MAIAAGFVQSRFVGTSIGFIESVCGGIAFVAIVFSSEKWNRAANLRVAEVNETAI